MKTIRRSLVFMIVLSTVIVIESCNQNASVEERNKASLLRAHAELFDKGNLNYADEVFTPDYAGQGPEWIKNYVKERREAFPDLQTSVEPIIAEGNLVAWLRTQTGTHRGNSGGYQPTGKKVTFKTIVFSRFTNDGQIAEEWGVSDVDEALSGAGGIDGVYEYLPPGKGQAVNRNGQFISLFGPADGKAPMTSQGGSYTFSGDSVKNTIAYSTDPKQIGSVFWWKVKSWSADTLTYDVMNEKGERTGGGRALRVSN